MYTHMYLFSLLSSNNLVPFLGTANVFSSFYIFTKIFYVFTNYIFIRVYIHPHTCTQKLFFPFKHKSNANAM